MNRVGPFRSSTLLQQLNRLETELLAELARLRAMRRWNPVRPGQQQSSIRARHGDAIWRDCASSAFQVTLPPESAGACVFVQRLGAIGQTLTILPLSGLIDGSSTKTLTTERDWALCLGDGEGWWTAE